MQVRVYNRYRKQCIRNGKNWRKLKFWPKKKDEVITRNGDLFGKKGFLWKKTLLKSLEGTRNFRFIVVVLQTLLQFESSHGSILFPPLPTWDRGKCQFLSKFLVFYEHVFKTFVWIFAATSQKLKSIFFRFVWQQKTSWRRR